MAPGKSQFRPEIEGLRAVAAILVAVFHIYLQRVSGGVDVFFAVSGFLLTTSLLAEADRRQRVEFLRFCGRLVLRLFPAAMLVLFAVCAASLLWMPESRWRGIIEQTDTAARVLCSIFGRCRYRGSSTCCGPFCSPVR
jgi:peptidoglycan/LPS O-acetylase OafA/YrhL